MVHMYHDRRIATAHRTGPDRRPHGKRLLKVLKGLAEYHDMSLGDLLEGIVLHAFDGKTPFSGESLKRIQDLKKFYASISIPAPATGSRKSSADLTRSQLPSANDRRRADRTIRV